MLVDLSLSAQSIVLLIPLTAVLSFLLVFVAPWLYGKMSELGFFGGAQMDPRGPGPSKVRYLLNSALHPSIVAKSSTSFGWGKGGNVSSAWWQVTLCDPMWHVSSRSGVATLRTAIPLLLTYLLPPDRGAEQSCPWVGLNHGLGWVGSGWVEIFQFLVGWVGSTIAKVV